MQLKTRCQYTPTLLIFPFGTIMLIHIYYTRFGREIIIKFAYGGGRLWNPPLATRIARTPGEIFPAAAGASSAAVVVDVDLGALLLLLTGWPPRL